MSPVTLSISQFLSAWRLLAAAAPTRRLVSEPGIDYAFSGVPLAFFNAAVLTGQGVTADGLRECGTKALAFAADAGVPWVLFLTHEALAPGTDAMAALDACGYAPLMPMTGMRADTVAPAASIPAGLTLREPDDDAGCAHMIDVNAAAYQMPLAEANPIWGVRRFWEDHTAVLGTADGAPVSCSVVWMVDGHRYVAMVATQPGHQRKGYADAAMRTALELARGRHGDAPTFLHATEAGRPVYERMGFEKVATHTLFMEKRFLEGH